MAQQEDECSVIKGRGFKFRRLLGFFILFLSVFLDKCLAVQLGAHYV